MAHCQDCCALTCRDFTRKTPIVCDRKIRTRATVVQQKTGRPVQFELMADVRASLLKWLELRGGPLEDYAFPGRTDHAAHISTRQYARLVDDWVTGIGLPSEDYGTHSLRRTTASIIRKATGNLRAVQILFESRRPGVVLRSSSHHRQCLWPLCWTIRYPIESACLAFRMLRRITAQRLTFTHLVS